MQAALIFLNAVFASAEIAVISMNDAKLKHLSSEGDKRARKLEILTRQPAKFLATIQVAITLASLLGGALAADNFAGPLVDILIREGVQVPENILHSVAVVLITLILTYFSLVFGELVPKRIAMKKTESMALGMSGMLLGISRVFAPLVWFLTASTNFILKRMGINPDEEDEVVTEEEIRMMLAEGNEQGTIQREESKMIQNVFEFDDTLAEQISTHRKDMVMLNLEDDMEEWERVIHDSRFTYYPVYHKTRDNIVGVLDTKDYFRSQHRTKEEVIEEAVDKPFFVPENVRANILFGEMRQTRKYFAVLVDEYGSVSGIATIHDLMEALVGDIEEEEAPPKPEDIMVLGDGRWRILGSAELKDVADVLKIKLPVDKFDTFNGFIWDAIGRVPADGEELSLEAYGLKIEIKGVYKHIVQYAFVTKVEKDAE